MTRKQGPQTDLARRIETRIPNTRDIIERWLERSEAFREMCEEYDECLEALDRWQAMAQTNEKRSKEFETLARELQDEIRSFLAKRGEGPH